MEPTAAIRLAEQRLITDFVESKNSPESLAASLNSMRASFVPSFFFKVGPSYNPGYANELLVGFLPLLSRGNEELTTAVMRFFQFSTSLLSAIAPSKFIRVIREAFGNPQISKYIPIFLDPLSHALGRIPASTRLTFYPFFIKLVSQLSPEQSTTVPRAIWELLFTYGSAPDLERVLQQYLNYPTLTTVAPFIGQHKPQIVALLFPSLSLDQGIQLLKGAKRATSLASVVSEYAPIQANPANENYAKVYQLYACILKARDSLEEDETQLFRPMAEIAMAQYPEVPMASKAAVLKFLYHASARGLGQVSDLLPLLDFDRMPGVSATIALSTPDRSLSDDRTRRGLFELAHFHSTRLYARLLRLIDFARLSALDTDFAIALVWQLTNPFPVLPLAKLAALHFLNRLPGAALVRLRVDGAHVFRQCCAIPGAAAISELQRLISRLGLEVTCAAVDLTGDCASLSFQYLHSPPPALLEELLVTGLIPAEALPSAFPHLLPSRASFFRLIALLELAFLEFGVDLTDTYGSFAIPADTIGAEHEWISKAELHALFQQSRGDYFATPFGRLVRATIEGITAAYQFEFQPPDVLHRLSLLLSFIVPIYTEPVVSLLLLLYSDCVGRKRPRVFNLVLQNALARVWRSDLPVASAPSLLRLAILVDGVADAVRAYPSLVSAAVAVDRDLARQLADRLPKPLPPLPTFLSFVGLPPFAEYVDICQAVIPPGEWVLLPGDAALLQRLPPAPGHAAVRARLAERCAAAAPDKPPPIARTFTYSPPAPVCSVAHLRAFLWLSGECGRGRAPLQTAFDGSAAACSSTAARLLETAFAPAGHPVTDASVPRLLWPRGRRMGPGALPNGRRARALR
jgi:hypothetical protein